MSLGKSEILWFNDIGQIYVIELEYLTFAKEI
jgi:hypothetical protein